MASKSSKAPTTEYPVSIDAHFQRVTGGRWTVVVPTDEVRTLVAAGGVSGVQLKSGETTDARLTGDVHKEWTFKGASYSALYTVPKESTGKGRKGRTVTAQSPQTDTTDQDATVAALIAEVQRLSAMVAGQTGGTVPAPPQPQPVATTPAAPSKVNTRTIRSSGKVSSSRPRGSSRPMALLD